MRRYVIIEFKIVLSSGIKNMLGSQILIKDIYNPYRDRVDLWEIKLLASPDDDYTSNAHMYLKTFCWMHEYDIIKGKYMRIDYWSPYDKICEALLLNLLCTNSTEYDERCGMYLSAMRKKMKYVVQHGVY